mmetsp:Transcript_37365/g.80954  ORF Transcript_37365/g.80954 Transcript_37365/m.80954 type:complete len:316 (-) Transcript_37365:115-1062(-)
MMLTSVVIVIAEIWSGFDLVCAVVVMQIAFAFQLRNAPFRSTTDNRLRMCIYLSELVTFNTILAAAGGDEHYSAGFLTVVIALSHVFVFVLFASMIILAGRRAGRKVRRRLRVVKARRRQAKLRTYGGRVEDNEDSSVFNLIFAIRAGRKWRTTAAARSWSSTDEFRRLRREATPTCSAIVVNSHGACGPLLERSRFTQLPISTSWDRRAAGGGRAGTSTPVNEWPWPHGLPIVSGTATVSCDDVLPTIEPDVESVIRGDAAIPTPNTASLAPSLELPSISQEVQASSEAVMPYDVYMRPDAVSGRKMDVLVDSW